MKGAGVFVLRNQQLHPLSHRYADIVSDGITEQSHQHPGRHQKIHRLEEASAKAVEGPPTVA
jgi:hypothetical protein